MSSPSRTRGAWCGLALLWVPLAVLAFAAPAPALAGLAWATLAAAPSGALLRDAGWPARLASPALGLALAALLPWGLARPLTAAAALGALHLAGQALGARAAGRAWPRAAALWLAVALGCALPAGGGLLAQPWPLAVRARTFDASPLVWVAEVGGLDWMRHPSLYERGGAVDLGPELRHAWGATSAWAALAAGACALALRSRFERRARVV